MGTPIQFNNSLMQMRIAFCIVVAFAIVIGAGSSSEEEFSEDYPVSHARGNKSYAAKVKELDAKVIVLNKQRLAKKKVKKLRLLSKPASKKRKAAAKAVVKALQGHGAASGKNSLGADINTGGRHYKSKTVTRDYGGGLKKKVVPPGYDSKDTWKDPWGHYYLGPSRRRIGAGFGRRRRTVYLKKKSVSHKKSRKILRKIMSFKKGKSVIHKQARHKYYYRVHKKPKYNWTVPWKHRHIGFAKKHIKHMWDTSQRKKRKAKKPKKQKAKKGKGKKKVLLAAKKSSLKTGKATKAKRGKNLKKELDAKVRRLNKHRHAKKKAQKKHVIDDNFWMQLTQQLEKMPPNLSKEETPTP